MSRRMIDSHRVLLYLSNSYGWDYRWQTHVTRTWVSFPVFGKNQRKNSMSSRAVRRQLHPAAKKRFVKSTGRIWRHIVCVLEALQPTCQIDTHDSFRKSWTVDRARRTGLRLEWHVVSRRIHIHRDIVLLSVTDSDTSSARTNAWQGARITVEQQKLRQLCSQKLM